jgi:hypothetical protein
VLRTMLFAACSVSINLRIIWEVEYTD